MSESLPIFVYGTLKRGEEREAMWPHAPINVCEATTRAALYDLGPYPALAPDDDVVVGELWFIREEQLADTLNALDKIEGFNQGGDDLYVRQIVECVDGEGMLQRAYTYFYADAAALAAADRVEADADGRCRWGTAK